MTANASKSVTIGKRLLLGLVSAFLAALLITSPIALVRGTWTLLRLGFEENILILIAIVASFISGYLGFALSKGIKDLKRQRLVVWVLILAGYFYIACAALCERLTIGTLPFVWFRYLGLLLVVCGTIVRVMAIGRLGHLHSGYVALQADHSLIKTGLYKYIRHPSYLGGLIAMIGTPMVFSAWLPLLAVPGMFVVIKWRIEDEEEFLVNEFGSQYEEYQRETWKLIPGIY